MPSFLLKRRFLKSNFLLGLLIEGNLFKRHPLHDSMTAEAISPSSLATLSVTAVARHKNKKLFVSIAKLVE